MQPLISNRTAVTPEVVFIPAESKLKFDGECYPENPVPFFNPVGHALKSWFEASKPPKFDAEFRLQYVNSASTKGFRALMAMFNSWGEQGTKVSVVWAYEEEDDAMEELGHDLVEDFQFVDMKFQTF